MDDMLQKSLAQYRQILDHARQLEQLLQNGTPEQLIRYTAELRSMQEAAGLNDRDLLAAVARDTAHWQAHPLYQERLQLLQQVVDMNQLILPKIHGMMSVAAADLAHLKEGRVAVTGYHQPTAPSPRSSRGVG